MNKWLAVRSIISLKKAIMLMTLGTLSACTSNQIITLEPSVKQLKDLNDHDRDGVIEAREQCADTILGATIDNYGCGTQTTFVEPIKVDVKFANDSYQIPISGLPQIEELANILKDNMDLTVLIEGHTSKVGSAGYNQVLSENRAKEIKLALVNEFNIDPERISSIGYSFTRLADTSGTEAAHATNRRIIAELSKTVSVNDMIWTIYTVDQVQ
ncbi:OmpA family protein [Paraglaciecola sp. 2405UD69-4]|uniref:OmpA family protein n=1 Tax=Paraglaciecola sp. 2405UD69-4 TaxID=3391836 RepID=UPI0039C9C602